MEAVFEHLKSLTSDEVSNLFAPKSSEGLKLAIRYKQAILHESTAR